MMFSAHARRMGIAAALGIAGLGAAYAIALTIGLLQLPSAKQPIGDPIFSILELLTVLTALLMIMLMAATHDWARAEARVFSLTALVFTALCAGLTMSVHFAVLTVAHRIAPADRGWMSLLLSYRWPSLAYALDILAWDVFFGLAMLFAAPVFRGGGLAAAIRILLFASGALALAGTSGAVVGDMQLRMIGVLGYGVLFPIAATLLAVLFYRTETTAERAAR